ncbi:MAG: glycosyltransferase family 4 protein [Candidatus Aenigmarchaeota archaeon]|nr:glycosyltransferase family 4 protein [Candidatus Aenigmarchaeota archaeon]
MVNVLILGSKEYPFGINEGDDPFPSGGMETYVDDLVSGLSKLCSITVITRKFSGTPSYEKSGNVEVYRVPWMSGKWLRNISFNFFSFLKGISVAWKSDIIYSNGIVSGLVGLVLGKIARRKTVFRPAGIAFIQQKAPLRSMLFALERALMKKSDVVLFHSDGEMKNAKEHFNIRLGNGRVILTGFDVGKFAGNRRNLRRELGLRNETVITSVSRLVPVKGIDYLIKACSGLRKGYHLLIVGSGPEESKLRLLVNDLGMDTRVTFAGFRRDIPEIMSTTDIFVVSSLSEGLPTSLLEAMAAGAACVVTDIGLPVKHMETGMVVSPGNEMALRNDIEALMENIILRKKIGENAAGFTRKNCTQKGAADAHMKLFTDMLS